MEYIDFICHVGLTFHVLNLLMNTYLVAKRATQTKPLSFLEVFLYIEGVIERLTEHIDTMTKEEIKEAVNDINNKTVTERLKLQRKIEDENKK